jgi:ElaB/YqjD/DUF883 family membrane-anchored ribosome-binding protein
MASTNGQFNSLDELERDAERTRQDLAHTVDELRSRISDTASDIRERVSPAAIKQDVKDYVHQSGQQLYHTIESRARENPLQAVAIAAGLAYPIWRIVSSMPAPILLIGAGIALSSRNSQSAPGRSGLLDQGRERLEGATAEIAERARYASAAMQDARQRTTETVQDAAARAKGAVQDATQRTKEQVAEAASRAGSAVTSTVETVSNTVTDAVTGARDAVSRAASTAASAVSDAMSSSYQSSAEAAAYAREQALWAGRQTRETFAQTMERHPLLVGGVGLALGALLASAIPSTAPERRMFGETNEELQRRAREMASRGYDAAKDAATEIIDDTVRAAKDQGLSVDALRDAADELGGKMRAVAEKATGVISSEKQSDTAGSTAAPKII